MSALSTLTLRSKAVRSKDEVLRNFVINDAPVSLGEMVICLSASHAAKDDLQRALSLWAMQYAPNLKNQDLILKKITKFRNSAAHLSTDTTDPAEVMLLCRNILDELVR